MLTHAIDFLIGHEFTHRMQDLSTAAYGSFKEAVIKFLGEDVWNARVDAMVSLYERAGIIRSREELEDEVTADVVGMLVRDKHAFETFLENKEKTFIDKVIEVFERIIAAISSKVADNRAVKDVVASLKELATVAAEAVEKGAKTEDGDARQSIIGEIGAAALDQAEEASIRMDNLNIARQMEERGDSALDIRMATGWERGADGLWRYEIMDAEVNLYEGDEDTIRKKIEVAEEEEYDFIRQSKADAKELRDRTNTYLAEMREKYGVAEGEETDVMTEEEITQLQSLTNKEIEFEDYKDRRRDELYNRRMALEAQLGYVRVKNTDASAMILSTRLGHILQGNDAEVLFTAHPSLRDIEVQFVTDIRDGAFAAYATKGGYKRIELNAKKTPVDMLAPYFLHEVQHAVQDIEGFAGGGNLSSLQSDENVTAKEAYDYYRKIAGEVEARNVSARINMTPEERRATLLSETEDVAREDQIFLREGAEMAMAKGVRLPKEEYAKLASTIMTRQYTYGRPSFDYAFTDGGFYVYDYLGDGVSIVNFAMPIVRNEEIIDVIYKAIDNGTINSSGSLDTFIEEIQSGKRGYPRNIIDAIKKRRRNKGLYIYGSRGQIDNSRRVPASGKGSRGSIATRGESGNSNESGNQELDYRYSLITPEMDAAYLEAVERGDMATAQRMVMEAAKLAMPNTKVVDEDGNPKVVYHGTPNNFNAFSKEMFGTSTDRGIWGNGFYFSDSEQYAKTYEKRGDKQGKTLSVFLNIKRPLFISLRNGGNEGAMYFHELMEKHFTDDIYEDVTRTDELMSVAQERLTADIVANGYDGIVVEYTNHIDTEYVAFEPNQIKSADPVTYDDAGNIIPLSQRFNPERGDIRYSLPSLVGVHNISLDKLRKVIKMGGLANPSVAVIDVDKQTHDDYGEYSLILPKNMVDARQGKNAGTWAGDAWTPTYPSVIKRMRDSKAMRLFYKDIEALPEAMRNRVRLDFDSFMDGRSANALAYWYLFEQGDAPELAYIPSRYPDDIANVVEEATKGSFNMYGLAPEDLAKCLDTYIAVKFDGDRAAFEAEMEARIARLTEAIATKKSDRVKKWAKESIDLIKEYGFDYDSVAEFIRDVGRDLRERGKVNIDATITAAREQIESSNREADYDAWRNNLDDRYGIEEYIFDGYTNSGDRKYLLHTIDNVSKWMKKQGRQGAVSTFPSFGTLVAVTIPKMTTLEGIRKRKALLGKSKEEYDAFRERWEDVYFELGKKLQPDAKSFEEYGYWRLIEAVGHKDPTAFIKKQYGIELSAEDTAQLTKMLNAIRTEYPARYFETKFERPLQLSDFTAAVVPNDIPLDVESRLKDAGVEVIEYEKGNNASRAEAMQEASAMEDVRFSIIGEDVAEMEHAGYIKRLCDKARESYSITSSIVVAATKEDYAKTIEEAGYSSRNSKMTLAVYLKNTDTIAINAENITEIPIFVESVSHENAHSITENLLMDEVKHVVQSFVKEEIDALQKVALKGYEECDPSEILDELISTFVQYFSTKQSGEVRLLDGYLKGYFYIDDLTDYMARVAIKTYGDRFAPIIKALMPILKKNLEINKERYERHETGDGRTIIRFDRAKDAQRVNERGTGGTNRSIGVDATDPLYDSKVKAKAVDARQSLYDTPFFNDEDGEVIYFEGSEFESPEMEVRPRTTEGMIKIYMDKRHLAAKAAS